MDEKPRNEATADDAEVLNHALAAFALNPDWKAIGTLITVLDRHGGAADAAQRDHAIDLVEHRARALLSPDGQEHDFRFTREAFMLARCVALRKTPPAELAYWQSKRDQLAAYLDRKLDDQAFGHVLTSLLICEGILITQGAALGAMMRRAFDQGPDRLSRGLPIKAEVYFDFLLSNGWLSQDLLPLESTFDSAAASFSTMPGRDVRAWALAVFTLLCHSRAPETLHDLLLRKIGLKVLERAAENLDHDLLDASWFIEGLISSHYVRTGEGVERYGRIVGAMSPLLYRIGKSARSGVTKEPFNRIVVSRQEPLRIGFVVHHPARLAHVDNLLTLLRGLVANGTVATIPFVYVPSTENPIPGFIEAFAELATQVRFPNGSVHPAVWLRHVVSLDHVSALVFVSSVEYLAFCSGYRVAPVMIYWAMKYHQFESQGVDGYLTAGNFFDRFRMIDGRRWRSTRMALPELRDPGAAADAHTLRERAGVGPGHVLFACIGRELKMMNPDYIDAIGRILESCPGSKFMWTGRGAQISDVKAFMIQRGIIDRCTFIGWLPNTKVAALAMDVYLDSFPFASGHTGYEAMAAGKPIVVLKTPEAMETSTATSLVPAIDGQIGSPADQADVRRIFTADNGQSLLPYVDTVEDYVAWGIRLATDPALRTSVGGACRAFVDRYARDEIVCAETTITHIREIVHEKAAAGGGSISW